MHGPLKGGWETDSFKQPWHRGVSSAVRVLGEIGNED